MKIPMSPKRHLLVHVLTLIFLSLTKRNAVFSTSDRGAKVVDSDETCQPQASNDACSSSSSLLTEEEVASFHRNGFLLKRKLVSGVELEGLQQAGSQVAKAFPGSIKELFVQFLGFYRKISPHVWKTQDAFRDLAVRQNLLGEMAAQLLNETTSIRILRDTLFVQSRQDRGCGFHIDNDKGWPADSTGVTFWMALSPMRGTRDGGGVRLARASHTMNLTDCVQPSKDLCFLEKKAPKCHEVLYNLSLTFDLEPGDTLLWDRYLWHRGEPLRVFSNDPLVRYSVRYVPGTARAAGPYHHPSVQTGEPLRGPHYPQVWPETIAEEMVDLADPR